MFKKLDYKSALFYWGHNPWNVIDFCRIGLLGIMVVMMIWTDYGEIDSLELKDGYMANFLMCYLQLTTWLMFLDYLNMFTGFRILMRFIFVSLQKVIPFLLIMLILLLGFALAFLFADGIEFKTCYDENCGTIEDVNVESYNLFKTYFVA
jgi:hypothetical protein